MFINTPTYEPWGKYKKYDDYLQYKIYNTCLIHIIWQHNLISLIFQLDWSSMGFQLGGHRGYQHTCWLGGHLGLAGCCWCTIWFTIPPWLDWSDQKTHTCKLKRTHNLVTWCYSRMSWAFKLETLKTKSCRNQLGTYVPVGAIWGIFENPLGQVGPSGDFFCRC